MQPWHHQPLPSHPDPALQAAWADALGRIDPQRWRRRMDWEADLPSHQGAQALAWPAGVAALQQALKETASPSPEWAEASDTAPLFIDLWAPAADRLIAPLAARYAASVAPAIWARLAAELSQRLSEVAAPALWADFTQHCGLGPRLLARVTQANTGVASQQHYRALITRHRADGLASLLGQYPVLGRLLGTVVTQQLTVAEQLVQRVLADLPAIRTHFAIPTSAQWTELEGGLSDPHRGGQSVATLTFAEPDGSPHRVVYKPKDLRIEQIYQALLHDLNDDAALPPLKTLRVLTRDGYGYVEHLRHQTCDEVDLNGAEAQAMLSAFYFNAGRLMAILHALNGTDCHYENLIAHGDQLVLIDTETLFHIAVGDPAQPRWAPGSLQARLNHSVLQQGLLPRWTFLGEQKFPTDVSALGVSAAALAARPMRGWRHRNSDAMWPDRWPQPVPLPTSLPLRHTDPPPLYEHADRIEAGFVAQAQQLMRRRQQWMTAAHLLPALREVPRRVVIRNTSVYGQIQQQQFEPKALVSEAAQGLVLEQLARAHLLEEQRPVTWPLFVAELRQMEALDIPYFEMRVDATDLSVPGVVTAAGLTPISAWTAVTQRLLAMDDEDVAFQARLLRGALLAKRTHQSDDDCCGRAQALPASVPVPLSQDQRQTLIDALLDQLQSVAMWNGQQQPEWLGLDLTGRSAHFNFGVLGPSFYAGSLGVALLQAHRGTHPELAAASIVQSLIEQTQQDDLARLRCHWRDQPLGLGGLGGLLLALVILEDLGVGSCRATAARWVEGLSEARIAEDPVLDLIGGSAGLLGPLLAVGNPQAQALAQHAGQRLLDAQQADGSWAVVTGSERVTLAGLSHGAAGMMLALARLYRFNGETAYLQAIERAWAWEQQQFDALSGNWRDLRDRAGTQSPFMSSWCHGAPGIALSRMALLGLGLNDSALKAEIEVALHTTVRQASRVDHLCCGTAGRVAILRLAAQHLGESHWAEQAAILEAQGVQRAVVIGSPTAPAFALLPDEPAHWVLPGLMTGLSGIALALDSSAASQTMLASLLSADAFPVKTAGCATPAVA